MFHTLPSRQSNSTGSTWQIRPPNVRGSHHAALSSSPQTRVHVGGVLSIVHIMAYTLCNVHGHLLSCP